MIFTVKFAIIDKETGVTVNAFSVCVGQDTADGLAAFDRERYGMERVLGAVVPTGEVLFVSMTNWEAGSTPDDCPTAPFYTFIEAVKEARQ